MSKVKIKLDPGNARIHGEGNKALINKSLKELGAGRSVVIDNEDYLIAGNGVFEEAKKLGIKVKVIESDGTELVVVKRTDLKHDDPKRRSLAIADNAAGDTSEFDFEVITEEEADEWGIEMPTEAETKNLDEGVIEFSNELDQLSNYVVLKFNSDIDWIQVQGMLGIESTYSMRANGKPWSKGVGRVVDGAKAIELIKQSNYEG